MDQYWKQKLLTWSVPIGLICALLVLAFLQFRWSVEVSDATTTRIRADLQTSMMNFRQDLSRDLGSLCLDLQVAPGPSLEDAKNISSRLEHWQRTSSNPALAQEIYLWQSSANGDSKLFRLVSPESRFENADWPGDFENIRQALTGTQNASLTGTVPTQSNDQGTVAQHSRRDSPEIGGIDESVPVLAIPSTPQSATSWLLVKLNLKLLQNREFPQLATRYFGDPQASDYAVGVIAGPVTDRKALYTSDPNVLTNELMSSDSSLNLFGPPVSPGPASQFPVEVFHRPKSSPTNAQRFPMSDPAGVFGPVRFDPIPSPRGGADWRVVVRHRKGSVEAAVEELRRRNLALSLGVLLVLAGSVSTILYYSQRAHRLAGLQVEFVAGVSHELRTPVAAILSISDNLATGVITEREKVMDYGTLIRNQARQLSHLVEQVLRFSVMGKGVSQGGLRPIHVAEVIQLALQNTGTLMENAGIKVQVEIQSDLPMVRGNFEALSQCIQNLITNAIKYGGDDKWMRICAELNRAHEPPKEIKVSVEDHGIGIESKYMDRIFEPFYRSPKVAESELHGTGLGLALAKNFAESMGGRIVVASTPGQGSAFTVYLPVIDAAQNEQPNR